MKKAVLLFVLSALVYSGALQAVEANAVKRATDKCGNWLIEQYDMKLKVFGKGAEAQTPEQLAMVITGLCLAPRDYKESNGPFISEPVKLILSKVKDAGTVDGIALNEPEALQWIITGLKATANPKYLDIIAKIRARAAQAGHPVIPAANLAHLSPEVNTRDAMRNALALIHGVYKDGKKEIEIGGTTVIWAEKLGTSLLKLQQPNGSFGEDIQTNALALYALNACYKTLK